MQRIQFTSADLAKVRLAVTLGPVVETVFSLELLGRASSEATAGRHVRRWRRQVHGALRHRAQVLTSLTTTGSPERLRWLLERQLAPAAPASSIGDERRRIARAVLELCDVAVLPYWPNLQGYLQRERDARGRVATDQGMEQLLATLHPLLRWRAPTLEILDGPSEEVQLDGRGLLIVPAIFLSGRSSMLLRSGALQPVLFFGTSSDNKWAALRTPALTDSAALGALLGRTRAAALRELADGRHTTSELAVRLGISSAGASQHTAVLRRAGLITTRRNRNVALHMATPLGLALLGAAPAVLPNSVPSAIAGDAAR